MHVFLNVSFFPGIDFNEVKIFTVSYNFMSHECWIKLLNLTQVHIDSLR